VTVTGLLKVTDKAGVSTPKASSTIQVTYQVSATTTKTVNVATNAAGVYTITVTPLATGPVKARYAGVPGWGASDASPVTITV
jgi:hypothetical protein